MQARIDKNERGKPIQLNRQMSRPQMTSTDYPVGYNPNRRMSNTSVNSSTDPDSDGHLHQRQMLRG